MAHSPSTLLEIDVSTDRGTFRIKTVTSEYILTLTDDPNNGTILGGGGNRLEPQDVIFVGRTIKVGQPMIFTRFDETLNQMRRVTSKTLVEITRLA